MMLRSKSILTLVSYHEIKVDENVKILFYFIVEYML